MDPNGQNGPDGSSLVCYVICYVIVVVESPLLPKTPDPLFDLFGC